MRNLLLATAIAIIPMGAMAQDVLWKDGVPYPNYGNHAPTVYQTTPNPITGGFTTSTQGSGRQCVSRPTGFSGGYTTTCQ